MKEISQYIDSNDIKNYIYHRGKMLLLSRITQYSLNRYTLTGEYDITKDCIFYDENIKGIPNWVSFEFMAQGASILSGIERRTLGKNLLHGIILSISDFKSNVDTLKVDTTIKVEVERKFYDKGGLISVYFCNLYKDRNSKEPNITAKVSVMESDDINNLFKD